MFFLLAAMIIAFATIRFSVRMIRAQSKWWPGNVSMGGLHIHHVVFGLGFMLIAGFGLVAMANQSSLWLSCALSALFGIGAALVLDEFALVLHLRDVYWSEEGRTSVDAVFVAIAFTGLFLLGFHPLGAAGDFDMLRKDDNAVFAVAAVFFFACQCILAGIVLLKGKFWTGFLGMFFLPLLVIGTIRLGRPNSPWARKYYANKPVKIERSAERERRLRDPIIQRKIRLQEALAGRFDE